MTQKNKRRSEKDLKVAVEEQTVEEAKPYENGKRGTMDAACYTEKEAEVQQMMRVKRRQNRRLRQKMILRNRRKL